MLSFGQIQLFEIIFAPQEIYQNLLRFSIHNHINDTKNDGNDDDQKKSLFIATYWMSKLTFDISCKAKQFISIRLFVHIVFSVGSNNVNWHMIHLFICFSFENTRDSETNKKWLRILYIIFLDVSALTLAISLVLSGNETICFDDRTIAAEYSHTNIAMSVCICRRFDFDSMTRILFPVTVTPSHCRLLFNIFCFTCHSSYTLSTCFVRFICISIAFRFSFASFGTAIDLLFCRHRVMSNIQ